MALADKYRLVKAIGRGAYGTVFLAKRISDGKALVCKRVNMKNMTDKEQTDARLEVEFLQKFDNINITKYYECIIEDGALNIFMEFAERGELYTLIQKRKSQHKLLSEDEIMHFFVQIALAVSHIHKQNILHRDLKSKNIFVTKEGLLKVGDFGIAKVLNTSSDVAKTAIGTPYYLSPEICEDKPYNQKSDVWALGCILYELTTLNHAFDGQSLPALVLKILSGKYPAISNRYSPKLKRLIDSMFRRNPQSRPSVKQMLSQPYVKQHLDKFLAKLQRKREKNDERQQGCAGNDAAAVQGNGDLPAPRSEQPESAEPSDPPMPAEPEKKDWFKEQEAALKELGQALNIQKGEGAAKASPQRPPGESHLRGRENGRLAVGKQPQVPRRTAPERERKPMPVFRNVPTRVPSTERRGGGGGGGARRIPVDEKWSKKRWLREQREKDEMYRLKAQEEAKKVAKSEALHAEIRANKEAKLKRDEQIKKQMARHKSGMKNVKPRLSKDMLRAAGAAFAERQRGKLVAPDDERRASGDPVLEKIPAKIENFVVETTKAAPALAVQGREGNHKGESNRRKAPEKKFPVVEIFVSAKENSMIRQPKKAAAAAVGGGQQRSKQASGRRDHRDESLLEGDGTFIVNRNVRTTHEGSPGVLAAAEHLGNGNSGKELALRVGIGQRIESLRVTLEDKIGEAKFIGVYKYLRKIGQTEGDPEVETQAKLENILGTNNIQYAFLIHKLLMLEDSLY
ncbi:protein kinase [Chloropicon primus]|nr:protein kinase [Chloropicon primus]